jgi:hypothetical protein
MKIRNGFVSNSSSSSFCIIGLDYDGKDLILELMEKEGFVVVKNKEGHKELDLDNEKNCNYNGIWSLAVNKNTYLKYYGGWDEEGANYAGLDAEEVLKNQSITSAKLEFQKLIEDQFNIKIPLDLIDFYYGEQGDG